MVNVATKEEFDKFKKLIEDRLDKMDKNAEERRLDILKAFGDLRANVDETDTAMHKRVDEVEEKSKSLFTRIKEAIDPVIPE